MWSASHKLPPFPMARSLLPFWKRFAISRDMASSVSAYLTKNLSFISMLSPHLRITLSRKRSVNLSDGALIDTAVPLSLKANAGKVARRMRVRAQVSAIRVVGGARSFCGDHRGAQRMLRRAFLPKGGAVVRFLHAFQNQAADTHARLLGVDLFHLKKPFRVVVTKLVAELVAALGNRPHAAPFAITDLEDFVHQLLGDAVAVALHHPRVLVFHDRPTGLELANGHQHPFEEIQGFKTGYHDRHVKAFRDRLVFPETHHRADMAGTKKSLNPVERRLQNRGHGGRHQNMRNKHR